MDLLSASQFAKMKITVAIPFVFVTAKNTLEDKSRALEVGGDDFITKPFNIDELILKIKVINQASGNQSNLWYKEKSQRSFY